jgi:hypothetical protein
LHNRLSNEEFEKLISSLPEETAEKLRLDRRDATSGAKRSVIAGVMAQNLSHNIGKHSVDKG